jgi:hypothetical protein
MARRGPGSTSGIADSEERSWAIFCLLISGIPVGLAFFWVNRLTPTLLPLDRHAPAATVLLAGTAALIWGLSHAWRMGVLFGEQGVTVRNFFRSYEFGWDQVRCFADGLVVKEGNPGSGNRYFWALKIVMHDGRGIIPRGTVTRHASRRTVTVIRQAGERYAIPVTVTGIAMLGRWPANSGLYRDPGGQPGLRYWDSEDREWSPLLQPDPASGRPGKANAPAEVYAPLPGSEEKWHDAAFRARRAAIWFAVWLVVTAGALAWVWAASEHDPGSDTGQFTFSAVLVCAGAACICWQNRRKFRKIDRAAKAAGELTGSGGRHRRPRR